MSNDTVENLSFYVLGKEPKKPKTFDFFYFANITLLIMHIREPRVFGSWRRSAPGRVI